MTDEDDESPSTSPVELDCKPAEGVVTVTMPGEDPQDLEPEQARVLAEQIQTTHTEEMASDETELAGLVADLEVAADQIEDYEQC